MNQQLSTDLYRRHYTRGIAEYRRGNMAVARQCLLKASEVLFQMASATSGPLREARKVKARQMLDFAKSIRNDPQPGVRRAATLDEESSEGQSKGDLWIVTELPVVRWDDVAGLEDVKAVIRKRVVYPFQNPTVTKKYRKRIGGGVLLYGPPGTGKTMIARAIANEVGATFFSVRCSDIISKWVGEAERNLKELFATARSRPRSVVFMDETEALVPRRGGNSTVMNRVIAEFLGQMDGIQGRDQGILLLGATNRPWDMDEAALRPGRFSELIYVPLPDFAARRQIMALSLDGIPLAEDVDLDEIARQTEGYSGADLADGVCEEAKDGPYEREIASGILQRLEASDLERAIAKVRPSVRNDRLEQYKLFRRR